LNKFKYILNISQERTMEKSRCITNITCFLAIFLSSPSAAFVLSKVKPCSTRVFASYNPLRNFFEKTFATPSPKVSSDKIRYELKEKLLEECRKKKDVGNKRERIESIISDLILLRPIEETAQSEYLQKDWLLEWTTEKEINFFSDLSLSGEIYQTIKDGTLENMIEFKKGGGLGVIGALSLPEEDLSGGKRTNFKFTSATLGLGKWGKFNIPPVGEGWFETVYLDENLRVDLNSRDDILICTPRS